MNRVCIYLRKSRADLDAETRGEGETLGKHRNFLLKYAQEKKLNIVNIREEIVSGESLVHRPEMLELLKEVGARTYDAVLCMDMDRLGRGNMQEQGLILETFKKSSTKIITPRKIYDLQDEFDEEYSEFEAFMARKELKIITRRLQRGRLRAIEEGNYISPLPPYGYDICYNNNDRTLIPNENQSVIIKQIFLWYTQEKLGANKISAKLNDLGYKTYTGKAWSSSTVLNILKNPVYIGKITWKKREIKKSSIVGQKKTSRQRIKDEWLINDGKHKAIISAETFYRAQEILNTRSHVPYREGHQVVNPLAGLIRCGVCGSSMILRSYKDKDAQIMCNNRCANKSSKLILIESKLLETLNMWLQQFSIPWSKIIDQKNSFQEEIALHNKILGNLKNNLSECIEQKNNLHDLLERNIYDEWTFMDRMHYLNSKISQIEVKIHHIKSELESFQKQCEMITPATLGLNTICDLYTKSQNPFKKNNLLKSILNYAVYTKDKQHRDDQFTLILYPKFPYRMDR